MEGCILWGRAFVLKRNSWCCRKWGHWRSLSPQRGDREPVGQGTKAKPRPDYFEGREAHQWHERAECFGIKIWSPTSSATQTSRGCATKLVVAIASPAGSTTLCQTGRTQGIQVAFSQKHRRARVLYPAARDPCAEPCHGIWLGRCTRRVCDLGHCSSETPWDVPSELASFQWCCPIYQPMADGWWSRSWAGGGKPHRAIFGGYGQNNASSVGPRSNQLGKIGWGRYSGAISTAMGASSRFWSSDSHTARAQAHESQVFAEGTLPAKGLHTSKGETSPRARRIGAILGFLSPRARPIPPSVLPATATAPRWPRVRSAAGNSTGAARHVGRILGCFGLGQASNGEAVGFKFQGGVWQATPHPRKVGLARHGPEGPIRWRWCHVGSTRCRRLEGPGVPPGIMQSLSPSTKDGNGNRGSPRDHCCVWIADLHCACGFSSNRVARGYDLVRHRQLKCAGMAAITSLREPIRAGLTASSTENGGWEWLQCRGSFCADLPQHLEWLADSWGWEQGQSWHESPGMDPALPDRGLGGNVARSSETYLETASREGGNGRPRRSVVRDHWASLGLPQQPSSTAFHRRSVPDQVRWPSGMFWAGLGQRWRVDHQSQGSQLVDRVYQLWPTWHRSQLREKGICRS